MAPPRSAGRRPPHTSCCQCCWWRRSTPPVSCYRPSTQTTRTPPRNARSSTACLSWSATSPSRCPQASASTTSGTRYLRLLFRCVTSLSAGLGPQNSCTGAPVAESTSAVHVGCSAYTHAVSCTCPSKFRDIDGCGRAWQRHQLVY